MVESKEPLVTPEMNTQDLPESSINIIDDAGPRSHTPSGSMDGTTSST